MTVNEVLTHAQRVARLYKVCFFIGMILYTYIYIYVFSSPKIVAVPEPDRSLEEGLSGGDKNLYYSANAIIIEFFYMVIF